MQLPWWGATEDYTINISGSSLQGTYLWSNGSTDSLNTTLSAGIQTCTITDLNNCTTTESITISEPSALNFSTITTNVSCNGGSNGTAELTVLVEVYLLTIQIGLVLIQIT